MNQLHAPIKHHADLPTEEALIASIIVDSSAAEAAQVVGADFTCPSLRKLFDLIMALHAASEPTTGRHLLNAMTTAGLIEEIGYDRIRNILNNSQFEVAHARFYAERLRAESMRRKVLTELSQTISDIDKAPPGADISNRTAELRVVLDAIEVRKSITIRSAEEIALASIAEKLQKRTSPVFTGLEVFDRNFGGFCGGDLVVLAARTSIGKTALALQIAEHNARRKRPVLYVTLEMRDGELIDRTLARLTGCSLLKMRNGKFGEDLDQRLTDEDFQKLNDAADSLHDVPLFVLDRPKIKVSGIRAAAKLTQARNDLSLLVVDFINQVRPEDSRRDRHEQIAQITLDLKTLAKELSVPVIALAQINRAGEHGNGEPSLIHLKESGALEEYSDQVLLLHRAHRKATEGTLNLAKNRHGQTDAIELEFIGEDIQFRCKSNAWIS